MPQKEKILQHLYRLKSFGETYVDPINVTNPIQAKLPQDITKLASIVNECHLCELSKSRKNVIFGEGNPTAKVMFIGDVPTSTEDDTGHPFVGRAGEMLGKMIENVLGLKREEVYITNILKCKPPQNRLISLEEIQMCQPYLLKQIEIIDPLIIVALGATSYKYLSGDNTPIMRVRGQVLNFHNRKLLPTLHPSYLLRNPSAKKEVFNDLLYIKELIDNSSKK